MPEHVHILICPKAEEYSIAGILQSIKQKEETIINSVRYIHGNPVRRGLVETPEQWYYSSALTWQGGNGPLKIDFDTYPVA